MPCDGNEMKKDNECARARLALFAAASARARVCERAELGQPTGMTVRDFSGGSVGTGDEGRAARRRATPGRGSVHAVTLALRGSERCRRRECGRRRCERPVRARRWLRAPLPFPTVSAISQAWRSPPSPGFEHRRDPRRHGRLGAFYNPTGMAIDTSGNLLVTDYDSARVRLVNPAGVVTTIAAANNFVNPFVAAVAQPDGSY